MSFKDCFSQGAAAYARARPRYPPELFAALGRLVSPRDLAWDCGTGNGQAALGLTKHFERVQATDASAAQLKEAVAHPRIAYQQTGSSGSNLPDHAVDLVTVAQAAHWFDLDLFYGEVRRVLRPGGVLAIWCYGLCRIDPATDVPVQEFYSKTVGPYWPPERHHIDMGYRTLPFPFPEEPFPAVTMELAWTLPDLIAYVRTWSAVSEYLKQRGEDPVSALHERLRRLWGDPEAPKSVVWALEGRIGRMPAAASRTPRSRG
jgi:SAM-dependent methyltransferase